MISCKITSNQYGFELNTDISQKNENCVIIKIDENYFERLKNKSSNILQKDLQFLFELHTGRL